MIDRMHNVGPLRFWLGDLPNADRLGGEDDGRRQALAEYDLDAVALIA
ncbi:MAG: hypothetical protein LCH80_02355 [Proteobacteria bacterium]|nr:hypothetical protein [Pseudomonadota bacterium]